MVSAGRVDPLKPCRRVAKLQASHQSALLQKLQHAIDARASHVALAGTQSILDLHRAKRT